MVREALDVRTRKAHLLLVPVPGSGGEPRTGMRLPAELLDELRRRLLQAHAALRGEKVIRALLDQRVHEGEGVIGSVDLCGGLS